MNTAVALDDVDVIQPIDQKALETELRLWRTGRTDEDRHEPDVIELRFSGAPIEAVVRPRCPRTRQTFSEHYDERTKHSKHRHQHVCKELAKTRRGRCELTEAQNRALFEGTIDLKEIAGHKLTPRQKAQRKILLKQRCNKPINSKRWAKSKQSRKLGSARKQHPKQPLDLVDDLDLSLA